MEAAKIKLVSFEKKRKNVNSQRTAWGKIRVDKKSLMQLMPYLYFIVKHTNATRDNKIKISIKKITSSKTLAMEGLCFNNLKKSLLNTKLRLSAVLEN